jgi:hypothetical protein
MLNKLTLPLKVGIRAQTNVSVSYSTETNLLIKDLLFYIVSV